MATVVLARGEERKTVEVVAHAGAAVTWRASTPFPTELTVSSWERLGWSLASSDTPTLDSVA